MAGRLGARDPFPDEVRRVIYTTNAIEALNRQLRKAVKTKGHFPTKELVIVAVAGDQVIEFAAQAAVSGARALLVLPGNLATNPPEGLDLLCGRALSRRLLGLVVIATRVVTSAST